MTNQDKFLTKKPILSIDHKSSGRNPSLAGRGLTALSLPADLSGLYLKKAESYDRGDLVEKSYEQAIHWYKKAADLGHAEAQRMLGVMYCNALGVEKSKGQGTYWYKKAADQGHERAQYQLGFFYNYGFGVEQSYDDAFYWFTMSADQGYSRAQDALGDAYYYGHGAEQSYEQAVIW